MIQIRHTDFGNVMHNFKLDKCAILEACMWSDLGQLGTPRVCLDTKKVSLAAVPSPMWFPMICIHSLKSLEQFFIYQCHPVQLLVHSGLIMDNKGSCSAPWVPISLAFR